MTCKDPKRVPCLGFFFMAADLFAAISFPICLDYPVPPLALYVASPVPLQVRLHTAVPAASGPAAAQWPRLGA